MSSLPEEEPKRASWVHSPRHTHAAAKSEGGGSDKETASPGRVEGEYGQKRLGQNGEKMGEKRSMTSVLRPIKKASRLACAGR